MRDIGRAEHTFVDVLSEEVPLAIEQSFSVLPTERMSCALWRFAKDIGTEAKAVAIFMTGRVAAYYAEAFRRAITELPVFEIHARRSQKQRRSNSSQTSSDVIKPLYEYNINIYDIYILFIFVFNIL